VAIDSGAASLCALGRDQILDGLVFAAKDDVVTDVWAAGRHNVRGGRHVQRDAIIGAYRQAVVSLLSDV
jgi:cytosine/adenosine deaminase-related metal-dependent hydrolase